MSSDIFDDVLNLEEQFYQEGYEHGYRDGAEAGRVEGRSVGMKQGYEKFLEAGRLQGRALVWANRIPRLRSPPPPPPPLQSPEQEQTMHTQTTTSSSTGAQPDSGENANRSSADGGSVARENSKEGGLPDLALSALGSTGARLERNVATLYGMVEPGTLSTRNEDEAVNDFDSRLKGAQGKLKVIERVVGEKIPADSNGGDGLSSTTITTGGPKNSNSNIEDIGTVPAPRQE